MSVVKVEKCWLQDSYQTAPPAILTQIQHVFRKANFSCLWTPLFIKQKAFRYTSLLGVLEQVWREVPRHCFQGPVQHTTALFCNMPDQSEPAYWLKIIKNLTNKYIQRDDHLRLSVIRMKNHSSSLWLFHPQPTKGVRQLWKCFNMELVRFEI